MTQPTDLAGAVPEPARGAAQALARKWRPRRFPEMIGQEHVIRALTNALDSGRLHHAYLFTGTRGVGKTTLARILAKSLNCEKGVSSEPCGVCTACREIDAGRFVDLFEVDAATNTRVEEMRDLLDGAQYLPVSARYKVYIIDEVHMLSRSAFNSMLKTLEEPPEHVKFILATTDPQKVPVTVLSRCLQFNLKNMAPQPLAAHLLNVLGREGIEGDAEALRMIAEAARGSVRDGLSLLDQAIAYGGGVVGAEATASMLGMIARDYLFDLLDALVAADGPRLMACADAIGERSLSFDLALQDLAAVLQRIALQQTVPEAIDAAEPGQPRIVALAGALAPETVQLYYQIALHGRRDLALAPTESAGFAMTLLRMLAFVPDRGGAVPGGSASGPAARPTRSGPPRAAALDAPSGSAPAARAPVASAIPAVGATRPSGGAIPARGDVAPAGSAPAPGAAAARPSAAALLREIQARGPAAASVTAPAPAESRAATPPSAAAPSAPTASAPPPRRPASAGSSSAPPAESRGRDSAPPWDEPPVDSVPPWLDLADADAAIADVPRPAPDAEENSSRTPAAAADPSAAGQPVRDPDPAWVAIVRSLAGSGLAFELARACEVRSIEGARFDLALPESGKQLLPYRDKLRAALEAARGSPIELVVETVASSDGSSVAALDERARRVRQAGAVKSIQDDPFVRELIERFDARLIEGSIRPVDPVSEGNAARPGS